MIRIKQPTVTTNNGKARLSADIDIDGVVTQLWFEVDEAYKEYLLYERVDAFILGLLHECIRKNHDVECETPMTRRLYFQLTDQFLPAYFKLNGGGFTINCPLADEVVHPTDGAMVGTGISCGVDSLHVFAKHPEITHACIWNLHGVTHNETAEIRNIGWENLQRAASQFVADAGCKLIVGDTNFDRGCIPTMQFDGSITYGNLFCVMALQKLWSSYFIASGYDITGFSLKANNLTDPAHYEYLLCAFCGLKDFSVYIDGCAQSRLEKVKDLINYPLAQKYLNVCWGIHKEHKNCTYKCAKCMRTLLELYLLGALDLFKECFDVDYVYSHIEEYLAEFYRGLIQKDSFMLELLPYYKRNHFNLRIKLCALRIVFKKAILKVLRLGRVAQGEFKSR